MKESIRIIAELIDQSRDIDNQIYDLKKRKLEVQRDMSSHANKFVPHQVGDIVELKKGISYTNIGKKILIKGFRVNHFYTKDGGIFFISFVAYGPIIKKDNSESKKIGRAVYSFKVVGDDVYIETFGGFVGC